MRPPAFQFYPDDFLAGTFHMTQKEVGAYIRLLCVQWNNGGLPQEIEKISKLAGGKISPEVVAKFQLCHDGLLRNQRLEKERQKQDQYRALQRDKGLKSAKARATAVQPVLDSGCASVATEPQPAPEFRLEPEVNSPSPSPSPSPFVSPSPNTRAVETAQKEEDSQEPKERPRNLVWDAICELFALEPSEMTKAERSKIGRVVKELKAATPNVTRDDIRRRAAEYRKRFPGAAFTPTALMSHWSTLAQPATPTPVKNDSWKVVDIRDCL